MYTSHTRTLYRSRHGVIFGVFKGLADYANLSVGWMRFFGVVLLFVTGILPIVPLYLGAAVLMKPEPDRPLDPDESEFYNSYTTNKALALDRLSRRLDSLDRRARRMEDTVTARGYEWDRRMRGEV